ncbi:MAG TPA: hypothetical protein VD789_12455, partial [Thermomicrobiales bacterium]|nr:hypothetical protein [Thermomicrobiales bacterium]
GQRVSLPELSGYNLTWVSPREPARTVEGIAQFTQASEKSPWTVRGLDMNTGRVSRAVEHHMSEDEQWINQVPYLEMESHLVAMDDTGGITVVAPETGVLAQLSLPPGIEPFPVQPWYLTVSPNGACITLSLYDDISTKSYIAPLTDGATWTEVDVRGIQWVETDIDPADTQTLPAQDFASPVATPQATNGLSCASPGYVPVVAGEVDAYDLAMIGFDGQAIVETGDGVAVPLPDGTTRTLPPGSVIYPDSDLALAIHEDNSATATRVSTGESWSFGAVEPRIAGENQDFFTNGRYVIGPTDDSRTDWLIIDTLTGERRTTADILGEPFEGSLDPLLLPSSDNGNVWVIQFVQITFSDHDETPPAEGVDPPGYLVIPSSLDDAWFSDRFSGRYQDEITVSPEGTSFNVTQTVRDPLTGERVDTGDDNLTYFGELIAYLDESTLLTYQGDTVQTVDIATGHTTPVYTANGDITSVAWDKTTGTLAVGSGTRGPVTWVLLDLDSQNVITELPELDDYQLASVSLTGPITRTDGATAFIQPSSDEHGNITVRALDMRTGALSDPITTRTDVRDDDFPSSPASTDGRFVETSTVDGDLVLIDSASGAAIELPLPDGVSQPDGGRLSITVTPSDQCVLLSVYDELGEPVGSSWVAPIEPGATWMEVPFSIDGWRELHILQGQTLLEQDLSTPISRDATSPPRSEAFAPDVTSASGVNVILYRKPTVESDPVTAVPGGTPLMRRADPDDPSMPIEETDALGQRWVHVTTKDGNEGWIRTVDMEPVDGVTTDTLNAEKS